LRAKASPCNRRSVVRVSQFFGFLKVALCAYTLFLSDTAFAGTAREGNGQDSDAVSYGPPEGNRNANVAKRDATLPAARATP
jgi:hypothetical protein